MLRGGDGKQRRSPTQVAAEVFDGYLDVVDGRKQVGIARIQRVLDETPAADHMPGMSACNVRVLLEACAVAGDAPTGLVAADRALESDSPVRLWEGETRRLRAEFLAALGGPANEVTTELERALGVGRRQGAKSLELRAATSLVRHRLAQGEGLATSGARTSLAKIIADLPENTETKNLIEAISALNDD